MKAEPYEITAPYRDSKTRCPNCNQDLVFEFITEVSAPSVHLSGATNMQSHFQVSVTATPKRVEIHHVCEVKPREKH